MGLRKLYSTFAFESKIDSIGARIINIYCIWIFYVRCLVTKILNHHSNGIYIFRFDFLQLFKRTTKTPNFAEDEEKEEAVKKY